MAPTGTVPNAVTTGPSTRASVLLVIAAAALWSTGGLGVRLAEGAPIVIAGLRSAFALAFMLVVIATRLRGRFDVLVTLLKRPLVWGAAASYALMVVMFVLSARRTTVANAIFIQYTGPIYIALLSGPLLGEKPTRRDLLAVIACVIGMAITFGGELGGGRAAGNALAILSSFGFAGVPLLLRVDQRKIDARIAVDAPLVSMTLGNALAAVVSVPALVAHPPSGPAQGRTMLVLFLLGTFQIGLPYVLYGLAVRTLRAIDSSLLSTIELVLSPIWVLVVTGERPSIMAALGGVVIISAVILQTLGKRRDPPAS